MILEEVLGGGSQLDYLGIPVPTPSFIGKVRGGFIRFSDPNGSGYGLSPRPTTIGVDVYNDLSTKIATVSPTNINASAVSFIGVVFYTTTTFLACASDDSTNLYIKEFDILTGNATSGGVDTSITVVNSLTSTYEYYNSIQHRADLSGFYITVGGGKYVYTLDNNFNLQNTETINTILGSFQKRGCKWVVNSTSGVTTLTVYGSLGTGSSTHIIPEDILPISSSAPTDAQTFVTDYNGNVSGYSWADVRYNITELEEFFAKLTGEA